MGAGGERGPQAPRGERRAQSAGAGGARGAGGRCVPRAGAAAVRDADAAPPAAPAVHDAPPPPAAAALHVHAAAAVGTHACFPRWTHRSLAQHAQEYGLRDAAQAEWYARAQQAFCGNCAAGRLAPMSASLLLIVLLLFAFPNPSISQNKILERY